VYEYAPEAAFVRVKLHAGEEDGCEHKGHDPRWLDHGSGVLQRNTDRKILRVLTSIGDRSPIVSRKKEMHRPAGSL
jgi:hypothetical protein